VSKSPHTFTAVRNISSSLSIARISPIASIGSQIERNTVVSITIPAPGTHAAQMEARIIIITTVICCMILKSIPITWATNIAAHA